MLESVKSYLNITWNDEATDVKLSQMIERAKTYINSRVGKEMNFEEEGLAKTLLLNYVMYENSGCLDDFFKNYHSEFLSLRIKNEGEKYAEDKK